MGWERVFFFWKVLLQFSCETIEYFLKHISVEGLTIILVSVFLSYNAYWLRVKKSGAWKVLFFGIVSTVILQHSYLLNLLPQFTKEITSVVLWCVCKGRYTSTALARSRDLDWSMSQRHLKSSSTLQQVTKCTYEVHIYLRKKSPDLYWSITTIFICDNL